MVVRKHVFVSGRVQGVTFRASTKKQAEELEVSGWVKNLPDGTVEAVFEGPEQDVEDILRWCRSGPSLARVEDLEVKDEQPKNLERFEIRY